MISNLSIRNFQSLRRADLDLGVFTVIVGPSSSGKSALIRAVRALASNVRGTGTITRGQKQMAISATVDPDIKVTLERSDRDGLYRLTAAGQEQTFTKLAGAVPAQITDVLRLNPGTDSVNFAGQFDKPYLLDESGAVIARELAELTNVNQLFEAVRQANRIRSNALSTLRLRTGDLDTVTTGLRAFQELPEQLAAFTRVEAMEDRRAALESRIGRLGRAVGTLTTAETALKAYQPLELPDGQRLADLRTRLLSLRSAAMKLVARDTEVRDSARLHVETLRAVKTAQDELSTLLVQVKVCPTCGQRLPAA